MDFDKIPDVAFLRVMEFLPFIDRVRVGRVSQRFREFSQLVVSRTKSLNFGDEKVFGHGIERPQAIALLELCSSNLEAIEFGERDSTAQIFSSGFRLDHCAKFNFARWNLTSAEISRVISDHSNVLESLHFHGYPVGQFNLDDGTICDKLHHLQLGSLNSESIESLIGRCPNLISFHFCIAKVLDTNIFDRFLATVPRVGSFEITWYSDDLPDNRMDLGDCANFWLLPLTSLKLEYIESLAYNYMDDGFVRKIIECFPDLEELALYLEYVSAAAALMLRHLVKLRELTAHTFDGIDEDLDVPIVNVSLESLDIKYHTVSMQALGNILLECPKLRRITIRAVKDIRTEDRAVELISYLENLALAAREITIVFNFYNSTEYYRKHTKVWKTNSVMRALIMFQERNNFEIRIEDTCSDEIVRSVADNAVAEQRRAFRKRVLDEDVDYTMAFRLMYSNGVDEDEEEIQGGEDEVQAGGEYAGRCNVDSTRLEEMND